MQIPEFLQEKTELWISQDIYNRKVLADTIYNYIDNNDRYWSVKIWLYGDWGSWKTTILRWLMEKSKNEWW
jgi:hypothetical protein